MTKRKQVAPEIQETEPVAETKEAMPPLSVDALLSAAGRWATLVGAMIGLGYLTGYIIVNLYLAMLGVGPQPFAATRYLATGLLYLISVMTPVAVATIGFIRRDEFPKTWGRLKTWLVTSIQPVICCLLALVFIYGISTALTGEDWNSAEYWRFWLTAIALIICTLFWLLTANIFRYAIWRHPFSKVSWWRFPWYETASSVLIAPLVIVGTSVLFARFAYPQIQAGYGGGATTPAQLIVDPQYKLIALLPMSSQPETTETVSIVDQTDDGYILWLTAAQKIVIIPKDAVHAVIVESGIEKPSPMLLP